MFTGILKHPAPSNAKFTLSVSQRSLGMREAEELINRKTPRNDLDDRLEGHQKSDHKHTPEGRETRACQKETQET